MPTLRWNLPQFGETAGIDSIEVLFNTFAQAVDDALTSMLTSPSAGLRRNITPADVTTGADPIEVPLPSLVYAYNGVSASENGFVVEKAGVYQIVAGIAYAYNPAGSEGARLLVVMVNNEVVNDASQIVSSTNSGHSNILNVTIHQELEAGDVVEIASWQSSGVTLNRTWARMGIALIAEF